MGRSGDALILFFLPVPPLPLALPPLPHVVRGISGSMFSTFAAFYFSLSFSRVDSGINSAGCERITSWASSLLSKLAFPLSLSRSRTVASF